VLGETDIFTRLGAVTVKVVRPVTAPCVAEIVDCPAAIPRAEPELLIIATDVAELAHTTEPLRSALLPSEYFPVATNCCVPPAAREVFAGVTVIEFKAAAVT